ncbi:MAG: amidase family protein, partial [Planctomycetota bacterium JB042]
MSEGSSRRGFLKAAAAAAVATTGRAATARDEPAEGEEITLESLVEAERVAGVSFTDAERRQMLPSVRRQAETARALVVPHPDEDGAAPPADDPHPAWFGDGGPAEVFDPRLPGQRFPRDARPPRFRPTPPRPLPSSETEVAFASLADLSRWVESRAISSLELTELYLSRLKRLDETLECVVTLCEERARAAAKRADEELAAGRRRGPLHGLPWGAKDLFDTAGIRTTWGAKPFEDRVPGRDATVVRRLDEAGAVLIAKLSLGALAYGDRWFGGTTRNPFRPEQGSSGSSAGSAAATVAGGVAFSLGTETYGSIGSPSARCGATGFRPTFGRVSRAGAMTLCWSLDK